MSCPNRRFRVSASLLAAFTLAAFGALALTPTTALGVEPIDRLEEPRPQPTTDPEAVAELLRRLASTPRPRPSAEPTPSPTPDPTPPPPGFDISYPQCGDEYPEDFAFAIVGVNGGRVHSRNPCLGPGDDPSQLEWAGRYAELYANTGNPGPELSLYWPIGQTEPRECDTVDNPGVDSVDCAYVYGWNAAEHAYALALDAFIDLDWADADAERLPGAPTWWLDVEDANSWRDDRGLNVAALEGAVNYLESMEVQDVGFYSTPRLWDRITGGTDVFADYPSWHAGASDLADAKNRCDDTAFTGGELRMVQWIQDGFDANHRC